MSSPACHAWALVARCEQALAAHWLLAPSRQRVTRPRHPPSGFEWGWVRVSLTLRVEQTNPAPRRKQEIALRVVSPFSPS